LHLKKPYCMIFGTYMHEDKAECCAPKKASVFKVKSFAFIIYIRYIYAFGQGRV